jgi:hypothetical protein
MIIYYVFEKQPYVDFHSLMELSERNRSFLYRFLKTHNINYIKYKNTILYKYEDILKNPHVFRKG